MVGLGCRHRHRTELDLVTDIDLQHVPEPAPAHEAARAARQNDPNTTADASERRCVEVVPVCVRDENRVHVPQVIGGNDAAAAQVEDTPAHHWVGENTHTVELDQHRRMTDVGEAQHGCCNLTRARFAAPGDG